MAGKVVLTEGVAVAVRRRVVDEGVGDDLLLLHKQEEDVRN
jgi:hypothetical protein